jgi:hypothetical protein
VKPAPASLSAMIGMKTPPVHRPATCWVAALQAQLQQLPNLKHLSVRQSSILGPPDLAISLLQSLPLTLRTLLYDYSGGTRGRRLAWHAVEANIPPHMRLVDWDWSGDDDDTRHVSVAGLSLHPTVASV